MRYVAIAMLALVACARDDTGGAVAISAADCVTCHGLDYEIAAPPHPGQFPDTCGDCHTTEAWRPARAGADSDSKDRFTGFHSGAHTLADRDPRHEDVADPRREAASQPSCPIRHTRAESGSKLTWTSPGR